MVPAPATQSIADLTTRFHKTQGDVPPHLIGASTTVVGNNLYLFGGRLKASRQISNKLFVLSLKTYTWRCVTPKNEQPIPRYFHSADHHNHRIYFFGGMSCSKSTSNGLQALGDLFVLNIADKDGLFWEYPTSAANLPLARYAHLSSIADNNLVIIGGQDINNEYIAEVNVFDCDKQKWSRSFPTRSFYGAYRSAAVAVTPLAPTPPTVTDVTSSGFLLPEEDEESSLIKAPSAVYMYSNYNVEDRPRQLHVLNMSSDNSADVVDRSNQFLGNVVPPHLRFPTSYICGQFMIVAGPCITSTVNQFHIWALNLVTMAWTRVDAGPALTKGSWLRGALCEMTNRFLVFGNPHRSIQEDYTHRLVSYEYVVSVDTEAFGIYRAPATSYGAAAQGLGLSILNDASLCDLTIVTTDHQSIPVNSAVLAQRWPSVRKILRPLCSPENVDPKIETSHQLTFPDTHAVLIAFLQFIYTDHLLTAQQHQPQILSRLLLLADLFGIGRLKKLTVHALHQMLNMSTASMIYETAALSNCLSLQIRALRVLINAKKMLQRKQQQQQQQQQQQPHRLLHTDRPLSPHQHIETYGTVRSNATTASPHQPLSKLLQQYDINLDQVDNDSAHLSTPLSQRNFGTSPTYDHTALGPSQSLSSSIHTESDPGRSFSVSSSAASSIKTPTTSQHLELPNKQLRSGPTFWLPTSSKKKSNKPAVGSPPSRSKWRPVEYRTPHLLNTYN